MSAPGIRIWNRSEQREEIEKVYGDRWVRWLYTTSAGQKIADHLLSRATISRLYGAYQGSGLSGHKVEPFIRDFNIPMEIYEPGPFQTFNDFFIRKFREGARPFIQDPSAMPAFAEARYLAYKSVSVDDVFPVKGAFLTPELLLGNRSLAKQFEGGPLVIARLCPVDYHRFHYPDSGRVAEHFRVAGKLHSVNPLALQYRNEIFATNERQVSILETENFGKIAYIEVGALCVGKIVQSHSQERGSAFKRGDEKGYFLFGGSTVIVLGQPGTWLPDDDMLHKTSQRIECFVKLGEKLGYKL